MATKKITDLTAANSVANSDLLVIVTSPDSSATTKKITTQNFFSNVSINTTTINTATVSSTLTVAGNGTFQSNVIINNTLFSNNLVISTKATPANSTSTSIGAGAIFYDNNFIYVATANNIVKRASLSTF